MSPDAAPMTLDAAPLTGGGPCPGCDPAPAELEADGPTDADRAWLAAGNSSFDAPACPAAPALPLAERIAVEASYYRSWGNALGDLLAATLGELAGRVRFTGASTVAEHEARLEVLESWAD